MMTDASIVLNPREIDEIERGSGVKTRPLVGKWNCESNRITSGITAFAPGTGLAEHTHNVEESVMVIEGEAAAYIDGRRYDLEAGQVTWVPIGVRHYFENRGRGLMRIYWVYGGRDVTRTLTATSETFEHLSEQDLRVGRRA
jgi:HTH-type transcriptional regulator, repressor for puuD